MSFDEFADIVDDEMNLVPDYVYEGLNGNVVVDEREYLHPAGVDDDLYILGTYTSDPILGNQVRLYYGSFLATYGHNDDGIRSQIRHTLRHEFLHHLEHRAGLHGEGSLEAEDRKNMISYLRNKGVIT